MIPFENITHKSSPEAASCRYKFRQEGDKKKNNLISIAV